MSSEVLRRAASLMRERATTAPVPVGPWETEFSDVIRTDVPFGNPGYLVTECATIPEAKHIASWHPAVALAVAESVDVALGWFDPEDCTEAEQAMHDALLTVARAYLGDSS